MSILILRTLSFPPFGDALVGSFPRLPPSRPCSGAGSRRRWRGCAGAPCRAARQQPLPKQSRKSPPAGAGLPPAPQPKGSESRLLATDTRVLSRGEGPVGEAHPKKGSGCPWRERGSCRRSRWFARSSLLNMDVIIFIYFFACSGIFAFFP